MNTQSSSTDCEFECNIADIRQLVSPALIPLLKQLKSKGVLHHALIPGSPRFEVLEFYGDSVLQHSVSKKAIKSLDSPRTLTNFRQHVVHNANLALAFHQLDLSSILIGPLSPSPKCAADVIEAILGELAQVQPQHKYFYEASIAADLVVGLVYVLGKASYTYNKSDLVKVGELKMKLASAEAEKYKKIKHLPKKPPPSSPAAKNGASKASKQKSTKPPSSSKQEAQHKANYKSPTKTAKKGAKAATKLAPANTA